MLTSEEQKKISDWITSKLGQAACPLCGGRTMNVGNVLTLAKRFPGTYGDESNQRQIAVPLECDNCAHIMLLNANRILR